MLESLTRTRKRVESGLFPHHIVNLRSLRCRAARPSIVGCQQISPRFSNARRTGRISRLLHLLAKTTQQRQVDRQHYVRQSKLIPRHRAQSCRSNRRPQSRRNADQRQAVYRRDDGSVERRMIRTPRYGASRSIDAASLGRQACRSRQAAAAASFGGRRVAPTRSRSAPRARLRAGRNAAIRTKSTQAPSTNRKRLRVPSFLKPHAA
jgi:hypothetical protein